MIIERAVKKNAASVAVDPDDFAEKVDWLGLEPNLLPDIERRLCLNPCARP